ncbi:MAG: type II secretion system F family protein [Nanoarchaeota archaeon]|nr:type II secretion system F family protein [Nanoarchaeota archaeon]
MQQIAYPKISTNRKVREIEKNLLAALQNILVQLNSGVPLFDILVNISKGGYGGVSKEFSKVVKAINAGKPQIETLENMAAINPSLFFRRAIWQLVNGMKSGANMSNVINEIINLLSEEQILQIQRYGSRLNPLAMFYMLMVVIVPSLGMTSLIILASFISLSEFATKFMFWGLYGFVIFFQIMFMGIIKSKRPNLLGD